MAKVRIGLGQINATVGDIDGNRKKIKKVIKEALSAETDLLIFPELALSGTRQKIYCSKQTSSPPTAPHSTYFCQQPPG